ncbi:MAG: TetR/AcrR family transcriptional regulator [Pseudomonadota bacterium]
MAETETHNKIIESFLTLLSEETWDDVTLSRIADHAGISLSEFRRHFDGKIALVSAFSRQIDEAVLDEIDKEVSEELPRERLMDILLSRFDQLAPHKAALRAMIRAADRDLSLAAQFNRVLLVSMTWMLNAANINTGGMDGAVRVQGTAMVFGRVMKTFVDDDESMAKTMAKLDRELRKGERNMRRFDQLSSFLAPLRRFKTRRRARSVEDVVDEQV